MSEFEEIYEELQDSCKLLSSDELEVITLHLQTKLNLSNLEYIIHTPYSLILAASTKSLERVAVKMVFLSNEQSAMCMVKDIEKVQALNIDSLRCIVEISKIGQIKLTSAKYVVFFVEELCEQSLMDFILQYKHKKELIPLKVQLSIIISLLDALNYIHNRGYAHGNVKLTNVLACQKYFKLSDMTLIKFKSELLLLCETQPNEELDPSSEESQRQIMSRVFLAPEFQSIRKFQSEQASQGLFDQLNNTGAAATTSLVVLPKNNNSVDDAHLSLVSQLQGANTISKEGDVFSAGILFLMVECTRDFSYESEADLQKEYSENFLQGIVPEKLKTNKDENGQNSLLIQLAGLMIHPDPNQRITCKQLLDKVKDYIEEKKIEIDVRIESFDVNYARVIKPSSAKKKKPQSSEGTDKNEIIEISSENGEGIYEVNESKEDDDEGQEGDEVKVAGTHKKKLQNQQKMKVKLPIIDLENIHKEEDSEQQENNVSNLKGSSKERDKSASLKDTGNNFEKTKKTLAKSSFFRGKTTEEAKNDDDNNSNNGSSDKDDKDKQNLLINLSQLGVSPIDQGNRQDDTKPTSLQLLNKSEQDIMAKDEEQKNLLLGLTPKNSQGVSQSQPGAQTNQKKLKTKEIQQNNKNRQNSFGEDDQENDLRNQKHSFHKEPSQIMLTGSEELEQQFKEIELKISQRKQLKMTQRNESSRIMGSNENLTPKKNDRNLNNEENINISLIDVSPMDIKLKEGVKDEENNEEIQGTGNKEIIYQHEFIFPNEKFQEVKDEEADQQLKLSGSQKKSTRNSRKQEIQAQLQLLDNKIQSVIARDMNSRELLLLVPNLQKSSSNLKKIEIGNASSDCWVELQEINQLVQLFQKNQAVLIFCSKPMFNLTELSISVDLSRMATTLTEVLKMQKQLVTLCLRSTVPMVDNQRPNPREKGNYYSQINTHHSQILISTALELSHLQSVSILLPFLDDSNNDNNCIFRVARKKWKHLNSLELVSATHMYVFKRKISSIRQLLNDLKDVFQNYCDQSQFCRLRLYGSVGLRMSNSSWNELVFSTVQQLKELRQLSFHMDGRNLRKGQDMTRLLKSIIGMQFLKEISLKLRGFNMAENQLELLKPVCLLSQAKVIFQNVFIAHSITYPLKLIPSSSSQLQQLKLISFKYQLKNESVLKVIQQLPLLIDLKYINVESIDQFIMIKESNKLAIELQDPILSRHQSLIQYLSKIKGITDLTVGYRKTLDNFAGIILSVLLSKFSMNLINLSISQLGFHDTQGFKQILGLIVKDESKKRMNLTAISAELVFILTKTQLSLSQVVTNFENNNNVKNIGLSKYDSLSVLDYPDKSTNMNFASNGINQSLFAPVQQIIQGALMDSTSSLSYSNSTSQHQMYFEELLDYFDDHSEQFPTLKDISLQTYYPLQLSSRLKTILFNLLLLANISVSSIAQRLKLTTLEQLFVLQDKTFNSTNQINFIDSELVSLNVKLKYETINLKNSLIISNTILQFQNLTSLHLDLSYGKILGQAIKQLTKSILLITELSDLHLDLSFCNMVDTDAFAITDSLKSLTNLQSLALHLRFNSIGNNGCTLFLSLLISLNQLNFFYLDVSGSNVEHGGLEICEHITSPLTQLTSLTLLLHDNELGDKGVSHLTGLLSRPVLPSVKTIQLNLSSTKTSFQGISLVLQNILKSKDKLNNLQLAVSGNKLQEQEKQDLTVQAGLLSSIYHLNLIL